MRRWARYLAPAAFLLAVTGVVILVRAGLRSDSKPSTTAPAASVTTTSTKTTPRREPGPPKRYYVIRSGDTLGAIAAQFGTTVAVLLRLNPGIQPTALTPGERIHVR